MKQIDHNQFWLIKDNPITKAGVFPYLGKQISPSLEPDKIYQVYRPEEEIKKAASTFKLVPLVDDHTMLGPDFTPAEQKGVHGVLGEDIQERNGTLFADVKIFSEQLKREIQDGKKELSLGYFCKYDLTPGQYNGMHYDAVQRDLKGNHIALVDNGRMGHDVRVMDAMAFDALDIVGSIDENPNHSPKNGGIKIATGSMNITKNLSSTNHGVGGKDAAPGKENEMDKVKQAIEAIKALFADPEAGDKEGKLAEILGTLAPAAPADDKPAKDEDVDKRALIDEIGGILNGKVDEEILRTVLKKAEKIAYNASSAGSADDNNADPLKTKQVKEADDKLTDKINGVEKAVDELPAKLLQMIAQRDALYQQVSTLVGTFDHATMTEAQVAQYACDKLDDLKGTPADKAVDVLKGYLKAQKPVQILSMDSNVQTDEKDAGFEAFMKGDK